MPAGPGWYPDPWKIAPWRWWDGLQWTAFAGPVPAAAGAPPVDIVDAYRSEERTLKWARAAVCAWSVLLLVELSVFTTQARRLRRDLDRLFHQIQTARPGRPSPLPDFNGFQRLSIALDLGQLLLLVVGAIFLVWQYHAARVAQGLGYPARTSPGFGVGSWFIPVINLWFPYWALRDCLPPDHPTQHLALRAWLAYLGAGLCAAVSEITAILSAVAAIIPLALALACAALAVTLGCRLITVVTDDHRQSVQRTRP